MPDTAAEDQRRRTVDPTVLALAAYTAVMMALSARAFLMPDESLDYLTFLDPWYRHIASHGDVHRSADPDFSDYNVPYLYLLTALTYLPLPTLAGIKWISILFDLALAYYTFRIVSRLRPAQPWAAFGAAAVVLFLPTVVTNSGWWGQCDALYAAFLVGGIHYVLRHRPWWACAFFGVAVAFKFQAVFLFPFLLVLVLVGRMPWRSLLAVPAAYLLLDVPALMLGADPWRLLTVYARQTDTYRLLSVNAPSVYEFVSAPGDTDFVRGVGVLVAGTLGVTADRIDRVVPTARPARRAGLRPRRAATHGHPGRVAGRLLLDRGAVPAALDARALALSSGRPFPGAPDPAGRAVRGDRRTDRARNGAATVLRFTLLRRWVFAEA
ncbi:hypothetical protein SALBM311S_03402 [Streptomyces alboniger]